MVKLIFDKFIYIHGSTIRYHHVLRMLKIDSLVRKLVVFLGNLVIPYLKSNTKLVNSGSSDCGKEIIVSLTSFPARINKVHIVIESILNQTVKPHRVILWLSKEQFKNLDDLPTNLLKYIQRGLEIRLVDGDLKSHKKYYYAFKEFPNDYVVLIDDDILYESTFINELLEGFDGRKIKCRYAFKISRDKTGQLLPYNEWPFIKDKAYGKDVFFGTGGGTIFIPSILPKQTLDINQIIKLCPKADDVWLNAMVRINKLEIIKKYIGLPFPIVNKKSSTLYQENVGMSMNDIQINEVNSVYHSII